MISTVDCAGVPILLAFVLVCALTTGAAAAGPKYEGFGSRTVGGAGGEVFWVDPALGDPADDPHAGTKEDPCTLRKALGGGKRIIKFTRGGTITLSGTIRIPYSYITIDGASAPAPGVTITHTQEDHGALDIRPEGEDIHDFIFTHLRFASLWEQYPQHKVGWRILNISAGGRGGHKVYNIIFDHLTMHGLQDKTTFWGRVENATVSWCLFYDSYMATLVSFYGRPYDYRRKGISFHHNVYARSTQRNPQLRGWIRRFDYVNNVVYGWDHYGMRVKNEPGERSVNANIINNVFCPADVRQEAALIYGWDPGPDYADRGPDEDLPQGTVNTANKMGDLYVAGNILPPENRDQYSTIPEPLEIPEWARVTTHPAPQLGEKVLPLTGMKYRNERENQLIDEVSQALKGRK